MKTKILVDYKICISIPLRAQIQQYFYIVYDFEVNIIWNLAASVNLQRNYIP